MDYESEESRLGAERSTSRSTLCSPSHSIKPHPKPRPKPKTSLSEWFSIILMCPLKFFVAPINLETSRPGSRMATPAAEPQPFISPYHCQPTFEVSKYDMYSFIQKFCIATPDGEIHIQSSNVVNTVTVHKDWFSFCNTRQGAMGGYLGKGTRKYAFKVRDS